MLKMGKRRFLSVIMSMALVFLVMPADYAQAAEATVAGSGICGAEGNEENVRWSYGSDGTVTISGTGAMADDVGCNTSPLYKYRDKTKRIVIGEGITSIGSNDFNEFIAVEEIVFPKESLKNIGGGAFLGNQSLRHITIPESVETIYSYVFESCDSLEEVRIPGNISLLQHGAFLNCNNLKNVVLAEGVSQIDSDAFNSDSGIQRLELPSTVTSIDSSAFKYPYSDNYSPMVYGKTEYARRFATLRGWTYVDATKEYNLNDADIKLGSNYIYTGQEVKPNPNVTCEIDGKNVTLYRGSDYELEYSNNIECGTASVSVTGVGCYSGSRVLNFTIFAPEGDYGTCGAKGHEDDIIWSYGSDRTLTISGTGEMGDYESCEETPWAKYRNEIKKIVIQEGITVIGRETFSGCKESELILPENSLVTIREGAFADNVSLQSVTLPETLKTIEYGAFDFCSSIKSLVIPGTVEYVEGFKYCTGLETVVLSEGVKELNSEFCEAPLSAIYLPVSLTNISSRLNAATIHGKSEYAKKYADDNGLSYIDGNSPCDLDECSVDVDGDCIYSGEEVMPEITVYTNIDGKRAEFNPIYDYRIEYANNVERGTATATIRGLGEWLAGSKEITYDIYTPISDCEINLAYDSIQYDGTEKKPGVEVTYQGEKLEEGKDYTLAYDNNIEEGIATVTVSGKGGYKGGKSADYEIYKKYIEDCEIILAYKSVQADGEEKKPAVTVKNDAGVVLKENEDYVLDYHDAFYPGEATVTVTGIGAYKGDKNATYSIEGVSIENAEIELNETIFTYDGSPKRPSAYVKLNGRTLVPGADYSTSYRDNVDPGTAYVIITGTGIYEGIVSMSFRILPYSAGKESVYEEGDTLISGNYVYEVTDDEEFEVELSSTSKKNISNVVIPATVKNDGITYKVTSIGAKAFYKNAKIKKVTIGNNVESIENYAFYGCKNITSVKFGKNVELIGSSSFRKCTKLVSITLPKSMEELGKNAFYGCKKLKTITINAGGVIDVEENAIKGISKKAVIKVPAKYLKKYKKEFKSKTGYRKTMKIKKK